MKELQICIDALRKGDLFNALKFEEIIRKKYGLIDTDRFMSIFVCVRGNTG